MKIIFDIEANGFNPTKVWVIVCRDIDTGTYHVFRSPSDDATERQRFLDFSINVSGWIGHNILEYDLPVLYRLMSLPTVPVENILDTFLLSKLIDYPRSSHSTAGYGEEFNLSKIEFSDYTKYTPELEEYCIRDVDICFLIYKKYLKYISNKKHSFSILQEHKFSLLCQRMSEHGFAVDVDKVNSLLETVTEELKKLDKNIQDTFVPRLKPIRTVTPKATKYGTISLSSIPKSLRGNIHEFTVDAPFDYCGWVEFNPASPKQVVEVLNEAGWKPTAKTKGHIEAERRKGQLERLKKRNKDLDIELKTCQDKLKHLGIYGWKVNEENLSTLPVTAPKSATFLSKRILYEARRRTLVEWASLIKDDGRIHGRFQSIGAWTHRMSHQHPNMANIANEFNNNGSVKFLGKDLRQCWTVPEDRLLVGVDAEGIQLRVFAHLVNDEELINAIVRGKKSDKTDPHSLNKRIIGDICKARQAAKRFIFALFLGGGLPKLAEILECSIPEAQEAVARVMRQYSKWKSLKEFEIPRDATRGWFVGLDGRRVRISGDTNSEREHLWMSGQLQSGEKIIVENAAIACEEEINKLGGCFVNIIHDEFQVECPNDIEIAVEIASILAEGIRMAGVNLGLNCPFAGSYWNDDHNCYTIGKTWYDTH